MNAWIHNLDPMLVKLGGSLGIRWYGVAYAAAFLIGGWLLRVYHRRGRSPLDEHQQSSVLLAAMVGVLAGGRLGYVLLYEPETLRRPWEIFAIWQGGMASHGGFVGVILAILWSARRAGIDPFRLGDVLVTLVPPGLLLGRLANFINGELWGNVAQVPWAVKFPTEIAAWSQAKLNMLAQYLADHGVSAFDGDWPFRVIERIQAGDEPLRQAVGTVLEPRHPSQLYEAGLEGALLLAYTQWRLWRTPVLDRPGRLAGEFLLVYAAARILGEQFREPDAGLLLGMSRGVFYTLFLFAGGLAFIARSHIKAAAAAPRPVV